MNLFWDTWAGKIPVVSRVMDDCGAYEGDDMAMIYEEGLADAYAGMNRFTTEKSAVQYQDTVRNKTQRGTDENEHATRDTRGAPEQRFYQNRRLSEDDIYGRKKGYARI